MSKKSVFCIASSREQADRIVDRLKNVNFTSNDISVLFPDKGTRKEFVHERNTKGPEGALAGAGTGGVVGGALGLIVGIGALAIPGAGPFIAAGPILAALSGAAIGAAAGSIAGGLIGLGIPEPEARRSEGKVKDGNVLLPPRTEDSEEVERAKAIFTDAGALDIRTTEEASADDDPASREDPEHVTQPNHGVVVKGVDVLNKSCDQERLAAEIVPIARTRNQMNTQTHESTGSISWV